MNSPPGHIEVAPFCPDCWAFDCAATYHPKRRARTFQDRRGLIWECRRGDECQSAIIMGGQMKGCRVRTAEILREDRGRPE